MISPKTAFLRFLIAVVMGAGLGFYYGLLRPLRPKHTHLSDLLFLPVAGWVWLYLNFAVCQGDLRLIYSIGLVCGGLLWEMTIGRLLRPVFRGLWRFIRKILDFFTAPWKYIFKKAANLLKFLLATVKKKGKITNDSQPSNGGAKNGKRQKPLRPHQGEISA